MSVFSPEMPETKSFSCDKMRKQIAFLDKMVNEIEDSQRSIVFRDETENNPNWIGGEALKKEWNKNTQHKRIYLEVLINNFEIEILKIAQSLG